MIDAWLGGSRPIEEVEKNGVSRFPNIRAGRELTPNTGDFKS